LVGGIEYLIQTYNQKTSILGISVGWKYMAVPFTGAVMLIETILQTVSVWNEKKKI
jgi:TRAP-type C4-dicarboxylate transport system permease small subunit